MCDVLDKVENRGIAKGKAKTLDEVYLHPKAAQMIEAFDPANQLVKDEVLALPEE